MRGLFGTISRGSTPVVTRSSGITVAGSISSLGSLTSIAGVQISQATAMTVNAVYRAVSTRSKDVARCRPSLYRLDQDGAHIEIPDHPVARLLRRPNQVQTWFEFERDMMVAYLLRGNAYAVILRDGRGQPTALIPVSPDGVTMLEAYNGSLFYTVSRFGLWQLAMLRDYPTAIPAEDMFHVKGLTFNGLVGVSTIGLARDTIGLAMGQSQQMSRWVGNGARPSGVLKAPRTLNEEAARRLKESWQNFVGGVQNVGQTAVLENGVEWQQLSLSSVDLDFINQCNLTVQDIARIFDMPIRKLMLPDTTRGSTIIQEDQSYVTNTVAPDHEMIGQRILKTFDLEDSGLNIERDYSQMLRADVLTRFNAYRIAVLTGIATPNETRRSEGLPPKPGGDNLMVPANTAALGSDMTGTSPDAAGRPAAGNPPAPGVPTNGDQPNAEDIAPSD